VTRLNKKIFALIIVSISALLMVPLINAQSIVWTDKPEYAPGESGTLYITFSNDLGSAITIQKIFITFEDWHAYRNGQWEGNQTLTLTPPVGVASEGIYQTSVTFVVPTDGRARSTYVDLIFQTAEMGNIHPSDSFITVTTTPRFMDQIVTLFTIQVVLLIVCTIIIAATIFLSARKPQVTWKAEEKVQ
jgi:hypothetical protein